MKYFSVDLETTGVDEDKHQIIEIGAVFDDLKNPKPIDELESYHTYVEHDEYTLSPYVLGMHSDQGTGIFNKIHKYKQRGQGVSEREALDGLYSFICQNQYIDLEDNPTVTFAAKNLTVFDTRFLQKAISRNYNEEFPNKWHKIRQYHMDPAILYMNPEEDYAPPGFKDCLKRAGFENTVSHKAVDDAKQVVQLIRHHFENK